MSRQQGERRAGRAFLMPAVVLLLAMSIFPLLWSLGVSFTDVQRGGGGATVEESRDGFLGYGFDVTTENFERMPDDTRLKAAARNTVTFVFGGVILQYVLGFGLALMLNQEFRFRRVARVAFLLPMMMTPVAAAYTGRMMFDQTVSPLAQMQRTLSDWLPGETAIPWLTDQFWARVTIVLIDTWQWTPFITLIILAGLQSVPDELYEAARVDGAHRFQIFRYITFPIMVPISVTAILIRGIEIFKIIDVIVITTGGGPGSATESLTMYITQTALTFGNFSYAAAISYVLLILVAVFATTFLAAGRRLAPKGE